MFFSPFFFKEIHEVNTYLIGCSETKQALLIDAGGDSTEYDAFLKKQEAHLIGIFITHQHWDHEGALPTILKRFPVQVYSFTGKTPNGKRVREEERIPIGSLRTQVLITTGHTPNSLSLVVEDRFVFVGDALFAGSIGGTDSPAEKSEEIRLIQSKIFTLPDETLICPGHGPMSTVGIEKNCNPFFV